MIILFALAEDNIQKSIRNFFPLETRRCIPVRNRRILLCKERTGNCPSATFPVFFGAHVTFSSKSLLICLNLPSFRRRTVVFPGSWSNKPKLHPALIDTQTAEHFFRVFHDPGIQLKTIQPLKCPTKTISIVVVVGKASFSKPLVDNIPTTTTSRERPVVLM